MGDAAATTVRFSPSGTSEALTDMVAAGTFKLVARSSRKAQGAKKLIDARGLIGDVPCTYRVTGRNTYLPSKLPNARY
jgi:hypothetical protein